MLDPLDGVIRIAAFSPDGKTLVVGGSRWVTLFDISTRAVLRKLQGHSKTVSWLDISRDGSKLATAGKDGTVRLWDLRTGKALPQRFAAEARRSLWGVAFSPDGVKLAACSNSEVYLWDVQTGKLDDQLRVQSPRLFTRVAFSPNGSLFAAAESRGVVTVFDVEGYQQKGNRRLRERFQVGHEGRQYVVYVNFSSDSTHVLTTGYDFTIRQWDRKNGALQHTMETVREGQVAVYSPDDSRIISVTQNETIQLWEAANGKLLDSIQGTDHGIRGLALSPNGRSLATFGEDKVVKIWNVNKESVKGITTKPSVGQ
jgi:WD40 repeat protein